MLSTRKKRDGEVISRARQKRLDMTKPANESKLYRDPETFNGEALPSEGWTLGMPSPDPEMYVAGVKAVRMADGQCLKYYKMLVRPEVLKKKRKLLKRKLRKLDNAMNTLNKAQVRNFLASIGKA